MENKNYYDILGVSTKASLSDITAAKNELAKRYHPDANIKDGVDTTLHMQQILEAYEVLSNTQKRAQYDQSLTGRTAQMQTFDLRNDCQEAPDNDGFVVYWKAAGSLYEIILESEELYHHQKQRSKLTQLAMQAIQHIIVLRNGDIPEKYWHPDIMNWLLFTWYKNRNTTTAYLLTLYDAHFKESVSTIDKLRLQNRTYWYQHSVKKLIKK